MRSLLFLLALSSPALALDLTLPAPVVGLESESAAPAHLDLPTGPFAAGALPVRRVEGALDRRAWRLDAPRMSLAELANPLRDQLLAQGYTLLMDCETRACGGFDFRFAIPVMAEPGMHVDLGEFRFLSAEKGAEAVTLLVSRSPGFGFVQLSRVAPVALPVAEAPVPAEPVLLPAVPEDTAALPVPVAPVTPAAPPADLASALEAEGAVVLEDLVFASGSAELQPGDYASLAALADWLAADAARRVALVGHTDASGGLAANTALSKRRAQAVRQVLLDGFPVTPAQVEAEGAGALAPRASNQTEEGRQKNRRVVAVVTSLP
jgi:outer membrane protein OmpA-like peptidoglycan-associated protein